MKTIQILSMALLLAVCVLQTACKGPQGDVGPAGTTGAAGPAGPTGATGAIGNANVIQISYGSRTHTGAEIYYDLTGMTSAQVTGSAFFTYVKTDASTNVWISLPGPIVFSGRVYNVAVNSSTIRLYINRTSGTGSEIFTATRIVVIPASDLRNGRKAAVDYRNYEEVKQYYSLTD